MNKSRWMGLGVAMGAAIGAALGVATHQMGAWLPLGIGIGMIVASSMANRNAAACGEPEERRASKPS